MSSIDSMNSLAATFSSDSSAYDANPWANLTPEERQRLAAAQQQTGAPSVAGLMGMTPKQILRMAKTGEVNKFSTAASAKHLPPPSAPKVHVTQQDMHSYQSMANDVNHALMQVARNVGPEGQIPQAPQAAPGQAQTPTAGGTPSTMSVQQAFTERMASFMTHSLSGMSSGDLMTAFLALQVQNQSGGLETRQALSNMLSQNREDQLKIEQAQDQAAEKAMQKALAKARQMGVLSKILAVFMVIITAAVAVATLGLGVGLALVAAAMAIGALAGGLKDGKKNGNGFDLEGALNGAALGGGIATAAVGLGAVLVAMNDIGMEMASQGVRATVQKAKDAAQQDLEKTFKELIGKDEENKKALSEIATQGANGKWALKPASEIESNGEDTSEKALKKTLQDLISKDKANTRALKLISKKADDGTWTPKKVGKVDAMGSYTGAKFTGNMEHVSKPMWQVAKDGNFTPRPEEVAEEGAEGAAKKSGNAILRSLGKSGMVSNPRAWKIAGLTALGARSVGESIQAGMQYKANQYNLEAETHQNLAAMAQRLADIMQAAYQDIQNYMQAVNQSHNKSVNQAMGMLSNHFQTQMRSAQAMVSG